MNDLGELQTVAEVEDRVANARIPMVELPIEHGSEADDFVSRAFHMGQDLSLPGGVRAFVRGWTQSFDGSKHIAVRVTVDVNHEST